jgi:hypothetical protein
MEWLLFTTMWSLYAIGPFPEEPGPTPGTAPDRTDLWLLRTTYEFVAARTGCGRCRATLGRDLRLLPTADELGTGWRFVVVTRCSGWRRHRHAAVASETRGGFRLGLFAC